VKLLPLFQNVVKDGVFLLDTDAEEMRRGWWKEGRREEV
jgi:hypothetical protein